MGNSVIYNNNHFSLSLTFQIEEIIKIHHDKCPQKSNTIQLSLDGVQEARSNTISNDVFSIKFEGCKNIYPVRIIRPINRYKVNMQRQIQEVINELNQNSIHIKDIVGDNPVRSNLRLALNSNSTYGCEYCEVPALQIKDLKGIEEIKNKFTMQKKNIEEQIRLLQNTAGPSSHVTKIDDLMKLKRNLINDEKKEISAITHRNLCWPASTFKGPLRTLEGIEEITDAIENNDSELPRHEAKGFRGKSILLSQPNFNFILNLHVEYMHGTCLGVVKRLTELTFSVGDNRPRVTKRKLSDPKLFNNKIKYVKLCKEFSRRCRNLDFSVMKASEFRNVILFFFIIVIDCIEEQYKAERNVWLDLAFVIRACIVSNYEFDKIDKNFINKCCQQFYNNYEKLYGPRNCTYSIHVVISHMLLIRGDSPLTSRSAFCFESFYSEMKNLFCPGTVSPIKQILKNTIMKRKIGHHHCKKKIKYQVKPIKENKENNYSVYTINENGHNFYKIISNNNDNSFTCYKQGKFNASFNDALKKKWSDVGVYKLGPLCDVPVRIERNDIAGKVIQVNNYLLTCPNDVLTEQ